MKKLIAAILLPIFLIAVPVQAQTTTNIEVDSGDNPLNINGWLGEEKTLVGNLRLTALGEEVEKFIILSSDLKRQEDDEMINRQQVKLIGEPFLTNEIPKDFQVQVTNISLPGTYKGELKLLLPGQKQSEAQVIPLTVTAKARPNLTPLAGTDQVRLRLVNCGNQGWLSYLDCGLAQLMLPDSSSLNQWELQFFNPTQAPVTLVDSQVVIQGEQTGYQLTKSAISLPQGQQTLPSNQVALPLTLKRTAIPPDSYSGKIYLTLVGQTQPLAIPIDLKMRSGPLVPILVLIIGIIVGQIFKYMQESGGEIVEAQKAVYQLEARIKEEAHNGDQEVLNSMVHKVRKLIRRGRLEQAKADRQAIEARLEALITLFRLEAHIKEEARDDDQEVLNSMVHKVRKSINQGKLEQAAAQQQAIEARLDALIRLSEIEERLPSLEDPKISGTNLEQTLKNIQKNIRTTREALKAATQEDVEKKVDEVIADIMRDLPKLEQGKLMGKGKKYAESNTAELARSVQNDLRRANVPMIIISTPIESTLPAKSTLKERLKNLPAFLYEQYEKIRVEGTFWVIQPLLKVVLLIGASYVGINSLYIENGATFGANPFSNYTSLIIWGLSADVASRNLSNLQVKKTEEK